MNMNVKEQSDKTMASSSGFVGEHAQAFEY
jgi:hypothetical protein